MVDLPSLLGLEFKTIKAMVKIYCKTFHKKQGECAECTAFLEYANEKLDRCPYGQSKPTCNKCPIHCYKPMQREQARTIMRYAGPRMLIHHPILAIKHLHAEKRAVPSEVPMQQSNRHLRKLKPSHLC
ncbi:nitrous oxide-stimulated promoter family protein [Psychromonas hadalis]|uniref:nitrous oxide-stimulated promoter family protein n=1 Tax=Psychromonas hadalis TaxID=211669 RepID=UPI0003B49C2C|nr:nitrous oxide-stimulated promoter family protein [Psychromonas hadalis]